MNGGAVAWGRCFGVFLGVLFFLVGSLSVWGVFGCWVGCLLDVFWGLLGSNGALFLGMVLFYFLDLFWSVLGCLAFGVSGGLNGAV